MKLLISHTLAFFLIAQLHGQSRLQIYETLDGKKYSQQQRDSIENAGNFVGLKSSRESGDTTYHAIFFYDKILLLNDFQKRYVDKLLPRIKLKSITGDTVDTDKSRHKVLMINFWSVSCGPCIMEFPQLNALKKNYRGEVYFIAIAPDGKDKVLSTLNEFKFDFTIIAEAEDLFKEMGIDSYPRQFFVDRDGIVRFVEEGVPVKNDGHGELVKVNGELDILVYENYSKILDDLINSQ